MIHVICIIHVLFLTSWESVSVCHLRDCHPTNKNPQAPDDFGGAIYTALDCNESAMEKSRSLLLGKHRGSLDYLFRWYQTMQIYGSFEGFPF